jgi:hypothetical protein
MASQFQPRVFDNPVQQPLNTHPRTIPQSETQKRALQRLPSQFERYETPIHSSGGPQRGVVERPRSYQIPGSQAAIRDSIPSVEGGADGPDIPDEEVYCPSLEEIQVQQHQVQHQAQQHQAQQHQAQQHQAQQHQVQQHQKRRYTEDCIVVDIADESADDE